ncbi:RNA polymerase sigma-70 factor [Chitinophaga niabensis]|uniref:RNA polymerase sigma-70 factor n=1 Tax=Chitinophaga niabensis TaxID=536979 RepID=UPI0031BB4FB6
MRVAEGNENAFAVLFNNYYNQLGDFIIRIAESEDIAQEIVQDVFLKIWINRQALAQVDSFKAYLFTVARNHAFNCLKQTARLRNRQKAYEYYELQTTSHYEEPASADVLQLVEKAVELLPPRQRSVFLLSRKEGISHELIARKLNISHETVKKHMVLALRFLRDHLRTNLRSLILIISLLFRN